MINNINNSKRNTHNNHPQSCLYSPTYYNQRQLADFIHTLFYVGICIPLLSLAAHLAASVGR